MSNGPVILLKGSRLHRSGELHNRLFAATPAQPLGGAALHRASPGYPLPSGSL